MMIYLDSNIVIYLVENRPVEGPMVAARLTIAYAAGDTVAISDLTRMECQVGPLKSGDAALLGDLNAFFTLPTVNVLSLSAAVFDRATRIRAIQGFKAIDSLHLASAVAHGCGLFLTNDVPLARFTDVHIEVLN